MMIYAVLGAMIPVLLAIGVYIWWRYKSDKPVVADTRKKDALVERQRQLDELRACHRRLDVPADTRPLFDATVLLDDINLPFAVIIRCRENVGGERMDELRRAFTEVFSRRPSEEGIMVQPYKYPFVLINDDTITARFMRLSDYLKLQGNPGVIKISGALTAKEFAKWASAGLQRGDIRWL